MTSNNEKFGVIVPIAMLLMLIVVIGVLYLFGTSTFNRSAESYLCILLTISLIALVLTLTFAASAFQYIDLGTRGQALGLPKGSVRAVIALSLILLFIISSVFIYTQAAYPRQYSINLSQGEYNNFSKEFVISSEPHNDNMTNETRYTVRYYTPRSAESAGIGDRIITIISTLAIAVSSFYFAEKSGEEQSNGDKAIKKLKDFKDSINTMKQQTKLTSDQEEAIRTAIDEIIKSIKE